MLAAKENSSQRFKVSKKGKFLNYSSKEYLNKTNVNVLISYLQAKRMTLDCVPLSGIKYDVRFFSFAGNMIGRSI